MSLIIPDEIIQATGMSKDEFKKEIAIFLFQQEKITLEQASKLAEMPRIHFQHLLASRKIPPHYDKSDFENDIETLRKLEK